MKVQSKEVENWSQRQGPESTSALMLTLTQTLNRPDRGSHFDAASTSAPN